MNMYSNDDNLISYHRWDKTDKESGKMCCEFYINGTDEELNKLNELFEYWRNEYPDKSFDDFDEYAIYSGIIVRDPPILNTLEYHKSSTVDIDAVSIAFKKLGAENSICLAADSSVYGDCGGGCMKELSLSVYEDGKVEIMAENQSDYFRAFDDLSNVLSKIPTELLIKSLPKDAIKEIQKSTKKSKEAVNATHNCSECNELL